MPLQVACTPTGVAAWVHTRVLRPHLKTTVLMTSPSLVGAEMTSSSHSSCASRSSGQSWGHEGVKGHVY